MTRLETLTKKVQTAYEAKQDGRDGWADWLYANHVFVVTDYAHTLAVKYQANDELAQAAAMLHDIADIKMSRTNPDHERESLAIARNYLEGSGFTAEEITLVVDDAIRFHSCHGEERPKSSEGLILATADSLAHLKTDFYIFAVWGMGEEGMSLEAIKKWALTKIERDLHNKIAFEDEREDCQKDYSYIKALFSR